MPNSDGTTAQPFFVWVRGPTGPRPQKWAELNFGTGNWRLRTLIAWQPIGTDEFSQPLENLARAYPPEKCRYRNSEL